jgi:hypothetical protein
VTLASRLLVYLALLAAVGCSSADVRVEVSNDSKQAVKEIRVSTDTGPSLLFAGLLPGEHTNLPVKVKGEAGLTVEAVMADGTTLKNSTYVEGGYQVSCRIEKAAIRLEI